MVKAMAIVVLVVSLTFGAGLVFHFSWYRALQEDPWYPWVQLAYTALQLAFAIVLFSDRRRQKAP